MSKTFLEKCICGDALLEELDDYILEWNESNNPTLLHEYLGFTTEEYDIWLHDANTINLIIYARENHQNVKELMKNKHELMFAARGNSFDKDDMQSWLKETGELDS